MPGVQAQQAVDVCRDAAREAGNALGSAAIGIDLLNAYRAWSSAQLRMLQSVLSPSSLASTFTTQRYWMLQSLDPTSYGPALTALVSQGLSEAQASLDSVVAELEADISRWSVWRGLRPTSRLNVIVLDTNVLLRDSSRLESIDWSRILNVFPHESFALGVPMVVVGELDNLKASNQRMDVGGERVETRTLSRAALRWLDERFPDGRQNAQLYPPRRTDNMQIAELQVILMIDDISHVKLADTDAEIIDRASALKPYVGRLGLATYDNAMIFRARSAGLNAFKPTEDG
ncbi:MAG: hypothetical protein KF727_13390 [Microbacteriaceae bacterium]|nr:hypothetical protein [Microbacteriaceae bacterium]